NLRPIPSRAHRRRCACRGLQAPQLARARRAACDRRLAYRGALPARVGSLLAGGRGLDGLGGASGDELASSARDRLGAREPISLSERLQSRVEAVDRKSIRLNSSHQIISYAVFCLKKKNRE